MSENKLERKGKVSYGYFIDDEGLFYYSEMNGEIYEMSHRKTRDPGGKCAYYARDVLSRGQPGCSIIQGRYSRGSFSLQDGKVFGWCIGGIRIGEVRNR